MSKRFSVLLLALLFMGCQVLTPGTSTVISPQNTAASQPPASPTVPAAQAEPTSTKAMPPQAATPTAGDVPTPSPVQAAVDDPLWWNAAQSFAGSILTRWQPQPYTSSLGTLPVNLKDIGNPEVIAGLSNDQQKALSSDGFTVLPTSEMQFSDIRFSVAKQQGQPYYLTTDAAYHALHVTFDELLKAMERQVLRPKVIALTEALLDQVQGYPAQGSGMEADTRLAETYLAVALRLFDPAAALPSELEATVQPQIEQIMAGGGQQQSVLIPNFQDDYSAYRPVGHYAGDPELENYYRGMTWFGRVSFKMRDPQDAQYQPSRAPIILTLALREAGQGSAAQDWKDINEVLNFMVGPSDDTGPSEFSAIMGSVYGSNLTYQGLASQKSWQTFLQQADRLPAPQINSTFLQTTAQLKATRDWRFLGQRFTFDASIFQNLIYDKVGTPENKRKLPTGLDVMAVFGSPAAAQALEAAGETGYAHYTQQMQMLQTAAKAQPEDQWLRRFYSGWLYSFFPQVSAKDTAYPPYMRSPAWEYKELNAALGSWAELKHDTVLYSKMPEFFGGGGPPASGPAPSYVEPNPDVFYRLAFIAKELGAGLFYRGMNMPIASDETSMPLDRISGYMESQLAKNFQDLGDIAVKELDGQSLDETDYETIQGCLGVVECYPNAYPDEKPVPVIAAVSGAEDQVLEVGVGALDRIYVIVPLDGRLQVAQGGIFSYYEFPQPRTDRLTDEAWREKLAAGSVQRPAWMQHFVLPGGAVTRAMAFRVNDVYIITEAGGSPPLNMRAEPGKGGEVLAKLQTGEYITIIDGPRVVDGAKWWKIRAEFQSAEGWVMEDPTWYERAYGQ